MKRLVVWVLSMMCVGLANAADSGFQKQRYVIAESGKDMHPVVLEFDGMHFEPSLSLLGNKKPRPGPAAPIIEFLRNMKDVNSGIDKDKILALWAKNERSIIEQRMTPDTLAQNSNLFNAITEFQLKSIIQYGRYYVLLVHFRFGAQQAFDMKYALVNEGGKLYLSDQLGGNPFFETVTLLMNPNPIDPFTVQ